jgi:cobalt-zinc-cadmium efflux system membrane fusion protein
MPKGKIHGWCSEHGVAECVLHHPELAQLENVPDVSQADLDVAAHALSLRPRPKNNRSCKLHLRRIQFASKHAVEKAGMDIRLADRGPIVETVASNGEVTYDPTRVTRLASRTSGTVWRVDKNIGDRVHAGDVLALIDSAEIGRVKSELLQAIAELELANKAQARLARLGDIVPGRRLQEIEAEQAKARAAVGKSIQTLVNLGLPISSADIEAQSGEEIGRRIQLLGLPRELTSALGQNRAVGNLVPLFAPRDGVIVQRNVVAGEVVDASRTVFTVVDTSAMWLMLDVPMEDAQYVRIGQKVLFRPDGYPDALTGVVTWTSTEMDQETRTVKVRAELDNENGRLLSETFGAGEIVLRETPQVTVVPEEAVHWEGCCHVIFVRDKDFNKEGAFKVFHTRMVRPGVTQAGVTELIAGVLPGEVVVTKGGGVLRAELLKGNLGAG